MKRLAALTLMFGLLPVPAAADDIQWLSAEFPPMVMSKGAHARQGYINALFDYVQAQLPQHRFTEVILPWPRVMHMAAQGGPYCLIAAFQTPEREAFLRFTEPYGYLIPLGMVAPASRAERLKPYLNASGQVSLEALTARHDLHPGVASGRSYGPQIDRLLAAEARPTQIHQSESTHALFQMLSLAASTTASVTRASCFTTAPTTRHCAFIRSRAATSCFLAVSAAPAARKPTGCLPIFSN